MYIDHIGSQSIRRSDELRQEKARITNLTVTARIETLEAMIRELEQDSTANPSAVTASEDATGEGEKSNAQVTSVNRQPDSPSKVEVENVRPPAEAESSPQQSSAEVKASSVDAEKALDTEKAKDRSNKLVLYKELLDSAKAESASPIDALASKGDDKLSRTPNSLGRASEIPDDAKAIPATSSSPTASSKPSNTSTTDAQVDITNSVDRNDVPRETAAAVENQPSMTSPPTDMLNQEKPRDQGPEASVQEPVFVKSEPVDFDFNIATSISNPPVSAEPTAETTVGAELDNNGAATSTYPNDDAHALQPAETSMEEDPLLAELFPTFPMGGSPAEANQMQAEEESDPMLAGMLQEVS